MATIFLDDVTGGRSYVARFTQDNDGTVWNGVSAWVAATTLTDAELKSAIEAVTTTAVTNESSTHIGYLLTVPAGIVVPCHVSLYLTAYTAGEAEAYGADYDPTDLQILEDTGTTLPGTLTTIAGYLDTEIAAILEDTGTTIPATLATLATAANQTTIIGYVDCLPASWVTVPTAAQIRTEVLTKGAANDEAAAEEDSLITMILAGFHSDRIGTTWTIYRTDDTTTHATKTLTVDDTADPITKVS